MTATEAEIAELERRLSTEVFGEGNKVVQRNRLTGTHEGELTGESVEITAIGITVWEDGKGVEHWAQADMMGMMQQLGVEPSGE